VQRQLLRDQLDEHRTRLEMATLAIEQCQEALAATNANIDRLKEIIPMFAERAASYYQLWQKTYISPFTVQKVQKLNFGGGLSVGSTVL
jgi:hypothetical protein